MFINYWAGLHGGSEQIALRAGAEILRRNALDDAAANSVPDILMIGASDQEMEDAEVEAAENTDGTQRPLGQ